MTKDQERFIELAKQYEKARAEVDALRDDLNAAMLALGYDKYAQDPETGAVYKTVKPNGTFIYYRDIDYKRTALDGERGGTVLSKKEAQEAGFDV
jgi:hypothetical protein